MFLYRLGAVVLGLAVAHPAFAEAPAAPAPEMPGTTETVSHNSAVLRTAEPAHGASLVRLLAFSAAHLAAARQAVHSGAELLPHPLANPSLLDQLPLVDAMRRHAGERWNTSDSSRPSDFALCYRLSRVMGFQVIPGDLTPAKLPTPRMVSVKNQGSGMGLLVGMTFRLKR